MRVTTTTTPPTPQPQTVNEASIPVDDIEDDFIEDDDDAADDDEDIEGTNCLSANDIKLMEDILTEVFTPIIADRRINEDDKCCLSFDGDRPQIEATYRQLLAHIEEEKLPLELLKFPAGCSLLFQPNDQMRSHAIIHKLVPSYMKQITEKSNAPYWLPQLETLLVANHIAAASRKTFTKFFYFLPTLISNAFKKQTIESGWKSSGLFPLNYVRILAQTPNWKIREEAEVIQIMRAVSALVEDYSNERTYISDEIIESKLQDNYRWRTKIIDPNLLNHARAVWLNSEGAIQKRKEEIERRRQKKIADDAAAERKRLKSEHKRIDEEIARLAGQNEICVVSFPFSNHKRFGCCKHGCKKDRAKPLDGQDDGWRKCAVDVCESYFCPNVTCQAFGNSHTTHHLRNNTMDDHFQISRSR